MKEFGDAAAERAADDVTEPVAIFAKTASGLQQMPGEKMIKGLPRELQLNNLYVGTYTEAHQVELEYWEHPEITMIDTGMLPTHTLPRRPRRAYLDDAVKVYVERVAT